MKTKALLANKKLVKNLLPSKYFIGSSSGKGVLEGKIASVKPWLT